VFIHGGAWRLLGKRDSAFAAETFLEAGAHFCRGLDFALLPAVTLAEMVAQGAARRCLDLPQCAQLRRQTPREFIFPVIPPEGILRLASP